MKFQKNSILHRYFFMGVPELLVERSMRPGVLGDGGEDPLRASKAPNYFHSPGNPSVKRPKNKSTRYANWLVHYQHHQIVWTRYLEICGGIQTSSSYPRGGGLPILLLKERPRRAISPGSAIPISDPCLGHSAILPDPLGGCPSPTPVPGTSGPNILRLRLLTSPCPFAPNVKTLPCDP